MSKSFPRNGANARRKESESGRTDHVRRSARWRPAPDGVAVWRLWSKKTSAAAWSLPRPARRTEFTSLRICEHEGCVSAEILRTTWRVHIRSCAIARSVECLGTRALSSPRYSDGSSAGSRRTPAPMARTRRCCLSAPLPGRRPDDRPRLRPPRNPNRSARPGPRRLAPRTTYPTRRAGRPSPTLLPPLCPSRRPRSRRRPPPPAAGGRHPRRPRRIPPRTLPLHDLSGRVFPPSMSNSASPRKASAPA
jgi:hypothetical protein